VLQDRSRLSTAGNTVYAPITEIGGVNRLWAISVNGASSAEPMSAVSGSCPGPVTVKVTGLMPGASVQIWNGKGAGSTPINNGSSAGIVLDLAKARVLTTRNADANGNLSLRLNLRATSCGKPLQAIDLATCATSNVATPQERKARRLNGRDDRRYPRPVVFVWCERPKEGLANLLP
jgi:hypothetical protein